jgi:hypothetical protein
MKVVLLAVRNSLLMDAEKDFERRLLAEWMPPLSRK